MAKYKFTYFLNTACAERRPQTRRDLIEDWKEEEKEFDSDLEAFEYGFTLWADEDNLYDLYDEDDDENDASKIQAIKDELEYMDPSDGETILISIEKDGQKLFDSGYTKDDFNNDFEDDEDYDDDDYLDENKKLNEDEQLQIDEKGLPVLEKPYNIRYRENDDRYQITSSHPYDETDYSWAISITYDINDEWKVIDPENKNKQIVKGWNEALDLMKKIDSEKKPRIDRT